MKLISCYQILIQMWLNPDWCSEVCDMSLQTNEKSPDKAAQTGFFLFKILKTVTVVKNKCVNVGHHPYSKKLIDKIVVWAFKITTELLRSPHCMSWLYIILTWSSSPPPSSSYLRMLSLTSSSGSMRSCLAWRSLSRRFIHTTNSSTRTDRQTERERSHITKLNNLTYFHTNVIGSDVLELGLGPDQGYLFW